MYQKFAALLQQNSISAYKVAKETGIPSSTFTFWKQGRCKPKIDKLQKLANYFGVSVDYFLAA